MFIFIFIFIFICIFLFLFLFFIFIFIFIFIFYFYFYFILIKDCPTGIYSSIIVSHIYSIGLYSSVIGAKSNYCISCKPDCYSSTHSSQIICSSGYYCSSSSILQTSCSSGHYCSSSSLLNNHVLWILFYFKYFHLEFLVELVIIILKIQLNLFHVMLDIII